MDAGFAVKVASDAATALKVLDGPDAIHGVIIDVGLPDEKGDVLARRCHERRPELPIVLTTGYDEQQFEQAFAANSYVRVLGKPFDTTRLLLRLEELAIHKR